MPEETGIALRLREEGICKLDSFLTRVCSARRLSSEEVGAYEGRSLTSGWEFHVQTDLMTRRLQVLVDQRFPFSLPHFFLVDRPEFLTWPHIEEDGHLCLRAENKVAKPDHPAEIVGVLLGQSVDLICTCESGSNEGDFLTEFYSYWDRDLDESHDHIFSLLAPYGPSRFVRIWRGESWSVVGESEEEVLSWLRHRHGKKPQFDSTDFACFLWLPRALLPKQYPRSAGDIYRLAQMTSGGKLLLERLSRRGRSPFYIILGADSGNGPCLAGVVARAPSTVDIRGKRLNGSLNGFRSGKIPESILTPRLFSDASSASRLKIERVDSTWIHGRGYDPHHQTLSKKRVVVVGCGSVGGPIAQELVMSGVGHLDLVDPGTLKWVNVGRHPLGAEYVGRKKAEALAEKLQRSYPHAAIRAFGISYEELALHGPSIARDADLIVSATAEWETDSLLNLQHVQGEILGPLLFTWTETHACAGHAVLLPLRSPCLQCGMTLRGETRTQVTEWPGGNQTRYEPACGAIFQPYGPVELQGTISLAASLALDSLLERVYRPVHRVWAGPQTLLLDAGGKWAKAWLDGHPERESGGLQAELEWQKDDLCPVCGGNGTGAASASESEILDSASSLHQPFSTT
jgi:molybdopterin/thiamine biosynthesis adenylyltransferase